MNAKTARTIRKFASKTGENVRGVKRRWNSLSPSKKRDERKRMASEAGE